ncbi:hypothetical protein R1sor_024195 [Riccia sorocarpa]|uniref:Protein AAR2 homolog n=1 Tax=Riccia sorocarpa TaxID=122646 RepID=A0ABD3GS66_9MARC
MSAGRMSSAGPMDVDEDRAPYKVHMHNADAYLWLLTDYLIFQFMQMFVVGPNFRGLKMILPGPHFVYYSSRSKHGGDSSPVTGFFIYANNSQVIVRRWDPQEERLVELSDSSEEERFALAAKDLEFDRQLAPYDLDRHKIWKSLTDCISPAVIERIEPVGGDITVMAEASLVQDVPRTAAEKRLELTAMNLDKMGQSLEAFGQWKGIVSLLLRCEEAFLGVIYNQLKQSLQPGVKGPSDSTILLEDQWFSEDNFFRLPLKVGDGDLALSRSCGVNMLRSLPKCSVAPCSNSFVKCRTFFAILRDASPVDGDLLRQMRRLKKLFESTMGWIFDADNVVGEEDDEAPVVVYEE